MQTVKARTVDDAYRPGAVGTERPLAELQRLRARKGGSGATESVLMPTSPSDPDPVLSDPRPDALERRLRIGCGSVFGLMLGGVAGLYWWPTPLGIAALVVVCVVFCGRMALRLGDRFWTETIPKVLSWW